MEFLSVTVLRLARSSEKRSEKSGFTINFTLLFSQKLRQQRKAFRLSKKILKNFSLIFISRNNKFFSYLQLLLTLLKVFELNKNSTQTVKNKNGKMMKISPYTTYAFYQAQKPDSV